MIFFYNSGFKRKLDVACIFYDCFETFEMLELYGCGLIYVE